MFIELQEQRDYIVGEGYIGETRAILVNSDYIRFARPMSSGTHLVFDGKVVKSQVHVIETWDQIKKLLGAV